MPLKSNPPILRDLSPPRRFLAKSSFAAAALLSTFALHKRGGEGDVLVAFGNLGDQLRMMNVFSRFDVPERTIDVLCNTGTEQAFYLYPLVRSVRGYANQGSGALSVAARRLFMRSALYRRGFVPHPFVTQPLAMAASQSVAAETFFSTIHPKASHRGAIQFGTQSYRASYENFFIKALGSMPVHERPELDPALRDGTSDVAPRLVLHPMTSAASRALQPRLWAQLFGALQPLGLELIAIGARSEEAVLREICRGYNVEIRCGRPLREVAELLASSRLFIGVDSSMMNLADAVGTPSVVLYVRTSPTVAGPYYTASQAVTPQSNYYPVGIDPMMSWSDLPPSGDFSVEAIVAAINKMLAASFR